MNSTQKIAVTLAALIFSAACSDSRKFASNPKVTVVPKSSNAAPVAPAISAPSIPVTLTVTLANHDVRSASKTVKATAYVLNTTAAAVVWSVEGPTGIDAGSIDVNGLYTSPAKLSAEIDVKIIATLASNSAITGNDTLHVVPDSQIFVGCAEGSTASFPVIAEVYPLPAGTSKLPVFDTIQAEKSTTVCMDQFDVPTRSFQDGFPGVPGLYEWFALHTAGRIVIPTDGPYTFRLTSDDGSIFYIDGTKVVDNDLAHSTKAVEGNTNLTAGDHAFVLDYFQGPADQIALQLFWKTPASTDFVIVPRSAFTR
ncbi:MAG: hypothetical protein H7249_19495 [Chitinophagaceae bacterium]|nr:hypothetical protein [Oligoflexus sp.]